MKRWWVSFWSVDPSRWEYHGPWWMTGERSSGEDLVEHSICAAVVAVDEDAAKAVISAAHDTPSEIEWRFLSSRPDDWEPFADRFRRKDWMRWPWPEQGSDAAKGGG